MPDAPAASDSDLLRRYADSRDEPAFRELVRRHLPFVYTTALRRCAGNTHRAEEIAQAVFTDLAFKAARLTYHTALAGWLHTSTRYAASTAFRADHRRLLRETDALAMQENSPPPDHAASWSSLRPVIDHALDQLSAHDRETLLLRFFENHSFAAIGEKLQLSEDAARKRTARALEKLHAHLRRRGITSTSAALGLVLANQASATIAAPAGLAATIATSALTTAATAAAGSAGVLSFLFMAQSKITSAALIAVASAATVGTAVLASNVSQQHATLASLSAQTTATRSPSDLARQLTAAQRSLASAAQSLRDTEAKIAALPPRPRRTAPSANLVRSSKVDIALANDPEYLRLWRQSWRESLYTTYGDLFAELNLPPEKLSQLKDILVTELMGERLDRSRALAAGLPTATDETKIALRASTDAALRALLGEDGPQKVRRAYAISSLESDISADLSGAGHPLTGSQERRLAALIHDLIKPPAPTDRTSSVAPETPLLSSGLTAAETNVIAQMGESFTPPQRELLADHFKFERERAAFEQRIAGETP